MSAFDLYVESFIILIIVSKIIDFQLKCFNLLLINIQFWIEFIKYQIIYFKSIKYHGYRKPRT